ILLITMTRTRKRLFCLLLIMNLMAVALQAQKDSSIEIAGRLQWKGMTLAGYPGMLKIVSATKARYTCPVDSAGHYNFRLPPGSYTITPALHYHWNGDDFIRINEKSSSVSFTVGPKGSHDLPDLLLDTIGSPADLPASGVALNFSPANARLLDDYIN